MSWKEAVSIALVAVQNLPLGAISRGNEAPEPRQACGSQRIAPGRNTRTIEDPGTHRSWRVEVDAIHPERPARLVAISDTISCAVQGLGAVAGQHSGQSSRGPQVVRQGDLLAVSEETPRMHGVLEAVALNGGEIGAVIRVRLKFAGKVMQAEIVAPGRALFIHDASEAGK